MVQPQSHDQALPRQAHSYYTRVCAGQAQATAVHGMKSPKARSTNGHKWKGYGYFTTPKAKAIQTDPKAYGQEMAKLLKQ